MTSIDLETSYYTTDADLSQQLARLGARARSPREALYQFYPQLNDAGLTDLRLAPVGAFQSPDESATLVIGVAFEPGPTLKLSGPGIRETTHLTVKGVPDDFWQLRQETIRYPLGWDVFLVGSGQVVGLPRTTTVEVIEWPM